MKKVLILMVVVCSVGFAEIKGYYSNFNDGNSFMEAGRASYSLRDNIDEQSINGSYYRSPTKEKYSLSINQDWNYQGTKGEYSPFLFISYNKDSGFVSDYGRVGLGIALLPEDLRDINKSPYYWKFSLAGINDSNKPDMYLSMRVKFKANINKWNYKVVFFALGFSETMDLEVGHKLNNNLILKYVFDYARYGYAVSRTSSLGLEIKI